MSSTTQSIEQEFDAPTDYSNVIMAGYLVSAVFFIMTLRFVLFPYDLFISFYPLTNSGLSNQESAKKGNWYGIVGMAFGICLALVDVYNDSLTKGASFSVILGTTFLMMAPAACIGIYVALRVVMTAMPELIACLHSFVGLAATLIGYGSFFNDEEIDGTFALGLHNLECYLGIFIGAYTFTGSLIAFGKLHGKVKASLPAYARKYRIRSLTPYDLCYVLKI